MRPDDPFDDPTGEDDELSLAEGDYLDDQSFYDEEGFGDGEGDPMSASKRREKTRREALRRVTPKVKSWAGRGMAKERRRIDRRRVETLARRHWKLKVKPMLPGSWSFPVPLSPGLIALVGNLYVQVALSLAAQKAADVTSPTDVIYLGGRAILATAIMRTKLLRGQISAAEANAYAGRVFAQLEPAEQVLKVVVDRASSGEAEDWDGEEEFAILDGEDVEDEGWDGEGWDGETVVRRGASRAATGAATRAPAGASERVRAARALREGARYLLRLERRLMTGGR